MRSRKYEYEDPPGSGNWHDDPTSDLGRISRQQDFLRRTLSSVLAKGLLNPSVAGGLIEAATSGDVVTDSGLVAGQDDGVRRRAASDVDPARSRRTRSRPSGRTINGAAVLEPRIDGENMQAVLAMFRGETSLAEAPEQVFETAPTDVPRTAAPPRRRDTAPATSPPRPSTPGRRPGREHVRHRPAPRRHLLSSVDGPAIGPARRQSDRDGVRRGRGRGVGGGRRAGDGGERGADGAGELLGGVGVAGGGDDRQLVERGRGDDHVARLGRPAVRQQHRDLAPGARPGELLAGGGSAPARSVVP